MSFSYGKKDKLKSKKTISRLFSEGKSVTVFPLRMIYLKVDNNYQSQHKVGVSVSKRNFKKAVERNRIKRILREVYRLNKPESFNNTSDTFALMILYIGKDMPKFVSLEKSMKQLMNKFSAKKFPN